MSALVNVIAWGDEVISENGSDPAYGETVSDSASVPSGNDGVLQPIDPEPEPKEEEKNEPESVSNENPKPSSDVIVIEVPPGGIDSGSNTNSDLDNYWRLYAVSVDSLKINYAASTNDLTVSINEVLRKNAKVQRSIKEQLSRIDSRDADYQKRVLYFLSKLSQLVSGNGAQLLGVNSASMDEIIVSLSLNDLYEVSADLIDVEEVSENSTEESESISADDVEVVSGDKVSDNSVSSGDIAGIKEDLKELHDDLKGIFIVNIFSVLFLALLTAGQLEQIIFKRLRG